MRLYRSKKHSKGSTLVEMCVVIVLLAILSTMTVSFSSLIGKFVGNNQSGYTFFEECAIIKTTVSDLLSSEDEEGIVFTVEANSVKTNTHSLVFDSDNRSLTLTKNGGVVEENAFKTIDGVTFELGTSDNIIKCTVRGGDEFSQSFILSLRCAKFMGGAAE